MADVPRGVGEVTGNVGHDDPDSGNPVGMGAHAVEFGTDPPQPSTDDDRTRVNATPQGALWTLQGHPNPVHREYLTTGAQTDDAIIDTVAAGSHIVVLSIEALVSNNTTVTPKVRIGFGTVSVPTEPASGGSVDGMLVSHEIAAGSGVVKNGFGMVGGDGEELRITCDAPTSGRINVLVSYYVTTL